MNKLYEFQKNKINILGTHDSPMFFASQIAKTLGYIDTNDCIRRHVWETNKIQVKEYIKKYEPRGTPDMMNLHPNTTILNEAGVYQLIFSSKLEKAKEFQHFVFSEILPTIRKTGAYKLPQLQHNQFMILNEYDLHTRVVSYLRKYYSDVLFNASLGELQDNENKRINSWKMGYTSGFPDLVLFEHNQSYNGLSIEFKSPTGLGKLSIKQKEVNQKMEDRGFKSLIGSDYDDIIKEINEYLSNRRFKCNRCRLKFHTTTTLKTHLKIIHRNII